MGTYKILKDSSEFLQIGTLLKTGPFIHIEQVRMTYYCGLDNNVMFTTFHWEASQEAPELEVSM
jgi:hypothetical protein